MRIGQRQRTARAVARRSGCGASAAGANAQCVPIEPEDRAAPGRHRLDRHAWRCELHLGHRRRARKVRHSARGARGICARAADIERHAPLEPEGERSGCGGGHACGRSAQQAVLGHVVSGGHRRSGARRQEQAGAMRIALQVADEPGECRPERCLDHGGIGAWKECCLHSRVCACDDVRDAAAQRLSRDALMRCIDAAVHERNRDGLAASVASHIRGAIKVVAVERRNHLASS